MFITSPGTQPGGRGASRISPLTSRSARGPMMATSGGMARRRGGTGTGTGRSKPCCAGQLGRAAGGGWTARTSRWRACGSKSSPAGRRTAPALSRGGARARTPTCGRRRRTRRRTIWPPPPPAGPSARLSGGASPRRASWRAASAAASAQRGVSLRRTPGTLTSRRRTTAAPGWTSSPRGTSTPGASSARSTSPSTSTRRTSRAPRPPTIQATRPPRRRRRRRGVGLIACRLPEVRLLHGHRLALLLEHVAHGGGGVGPPSAAAHAEGAQQLVAGPLLLEEARVVARPHELVAPQGAKGRVEGLRVGEAAGVAPPPRHLQLQEPPLLAARPVEVHHPLAAGDALRAREARGGRYGVDRPVDLLAEARDLQLELGELLEVRLAVEAR
mmetsp:Transcript_5031/g.16420  ORF Transcript_5031/g.16420 Transcript_5031/m.16420 type:complete len:386 (-) Transcript_5031:968-2125(-)